MGARRQTVLAVIFFLTACAVSSFGQAGRRPAASGGRGALLNVVAAREGGSTTPISTKDVALYDDGIEQAVQSFAPDKSPARIVLLIDNSATLRTDVPKLAQVPREFAYEIYDGDQVLLVGYDENAEILQDWTDNPKKIEASLKILRKRGEPHLFDALSATIDALAPFNSTRKRVIVLIGDGLDRGSRTKFDKILAELQREDITVYALQVPDRTGGAFRRDQPKPSEVVRLLAEGTGGRVLPLKEPREAAKMICDELRKNRYILSYNPTNVSTTDARRLLLLANDGITVRAKSAQPGTSY
jgi:VWFA-related protein